MGEPRAGWYCAARCQMLTNASCRISSATARRRTMRVTQPNKTGEVSAYSCSSACDCPCAQAPSNSASLASAVDRVSEALIGGTGVAESGGGRLAGGCLVQFAQPRVLVAVGEIDCQPDEQPQREPLPGPAREAEHQQNTADNAEDRNQRYPRCAKRPLGIRIRAPQDWNAETNDGKCHQRADRDDIRQQV